MTHTDTKLTIDPEIVSKLHSGESGFCFAAHSDGSDNRIDSDAIMDAATVGATIGIMTAVFQGLKKAFRNRGKTQDDLQAEKEAAKINKTCGSLDLLLGDYLEAAQKGIVEEDDLDLLIDTLRDTESCYQSGKLKVSGEKELAVISQSIADFTAAMTGCEAAETSAADPFRRILEQLVRQKEWISKKSPV